MEKIQVLRHLGRTSGQAAEAAGAGALVEEGERGAMVEDADALLGGEARVETGAIHLVQIVEVSIVVMVETVWVV